MLGQDGGEGEKGAAGDENDWIGVDSGHSVTSCIGLTPNGAKERVASFLCPTLFPLSRDRCSDGLTCRKNRSAEDSKGG